jgi:hypothetical protein
MGRGVANLVGRSIVMLDELNLELRNFSCNLKRPEYSFGADILLDN